MFLALMIFGMWSYTPSAMPVMPQACHRPTIPQETNRKMHALSHLKKTDVSQRQHRQPVFPTLFRTKPLFRRPGSIVVVKLTSQGQRTLFFFLFVLCRSDSFVFSQPAYAYAVPWGCTHAKRARACIGAAQAPAALPNFALTALKNSATVCMPK